MQNLSGKIASMVFVILLGLVLYLSFDLETKEELKISVIDINGNIHLPENAYLDYAKLSDSTLGKEKADYSLLTLQLIRDRFQKHPYIKNVVVSYEGKGEVVVNITEKEFKALLLSGDDRYLMTKEMEILPVLDHTQKINYPVIQINPEEQGVENFQVAKNNEELKTSFKILTAAKLLNPGLYDNLSEIDLRDGKNVVIYFSSVDYPVILGRENEIKKMVVFERLWESIGTVQANKLLEYVDLRFTDKVFLGISGDVLQVEETQS